MLTFSRPEGFDVPISYTIYQPHDCYFGDCLSFASEVFLFDVGHSSPIWVPCKKMGDGLFEPWRFHFVQPQFQDETYLEDPFAEIKESYRIRSKPYPMVCAFVLDYNGMWQPVLLKPVLARITELNDEFAALSTRGVILDSDKCATRIVTGEEVSNNWRSVNHFICVASWRRSIKIASLIQDDGGELLSTDTGSSDIESLW